MMRGHGSLPSSFGWRIPDKEHRRFVDLGTLRLVYRDDGSARGNFSRVEGNRNAARAD